MVTIICAMNPGRMERPPPIPNSLTVHTAMTSSCLRTLYVSNAAGMSTLTDADVDDSLKTQDRTLQSSVTRNVYTRAKTKVISSSDGFIVEFKWHIPAAKSNSTLKMVHIHRAAWPQVPSAARILYYCRWQPSTLYVNVVLNTNYAPV